MREHFVRMSRFGRQGRFGNQLFQYAYLRIMAERASADLELPDWVGQRFFGLPRHPISDRPALRTLEEPRGDYHIRFGCRLGFEADLRDADVAGYFHYSTRQYRPYTAQWKEWFEPAREYRQRLRPAIERARSIGETLIGVHLRRGDYGYRYFYLTPVEWYQKWLEENWERFTRPVLLVASEDPALVASFARWQPHTIRALGGRLPADPFHTPDDQQPRRSLAATPKLDFFADYYMLTQCDILLIPNSTFSFAAAMSGSPKACWRSSLPHAGFIALDPWDDYPLQYDRVEQFPHLKGISRARLQLPKRG